jgi:hypothetical protein
VRKELTDRKELDMAETETTLNLATTRLFPRQLPRVSWGALFAGFFAGVGLLLLLLSLGAATGLTTIDLRDTASFAKMGVGAGIWDGLAAIIAAFVAAWAMGRLSSAVDRTSGMLHGVALWGLTWFVGLWVGVSALGQAQTAGALAGEAVAGDRAGAWGAFLAAAFTLVASALGGASGVGSHLKAIAREVAERAPIETRPLEPQRA